MRAALSEHRALVGLLSRRQAAERLQVGTETLDAYRRAGLLPQVETPEGRKRYRAADVDRARYRRDCNGWCPGCGYRFTARSHGLVCGAEA